MNKETMNITTSGPTVVVASGQGSNAEMHIRQDFVSDSDYNLSKGNVSSTQQPWRRRWHGRGWTQEFIEAESGG